VEETPAEAAAIFVPHQRLVARTGAVDIGAQKGAGAVPLLDQIVAVVEEAGRRAAARLYDLAILLIS
jgi:hypothetical protein